LAGLDVLAALELLVAGLELFAGLAELVLFAGLTELELFAGLAGLAGLVLLAALGALEAPEALLGLEALLALELLFEEFDGLEAFELDLEALLLLDESSKLLARRALSARLDKSLLSSYKLSYRKLRAFLVRLLKKLTSNRSRSAANSLATRLRVCSRDCVEFEPRTFDKTPTI
jgi:hypothetical protein